MGKEQINDGGPAFPCEGGDMSGLHAHPGMSLLEYYAGQSLIAILLASLQGHTTRSSNPNIPLGPDDYAKAAWENAVAMIKAREEL